MTKKERAIKDINVKELNANWRTALFVSVLVSLVIGFVVGWFVVRLQIDDSTAKAIQIVNQVSKVSQ